MTAGNLTTVDAVRTFMQKQAAATAQDEVIETLITAASAVITTYASRQFFPEQGVTKNFVWNGASGWLSLEPYDLRSVTKIEVDTDLEDGGVELGFENFRLGPTGSADGLFRSIELNNEGIGWGAPRWTTHRQLSITGNWGFEEIPADVAHWTTVTVALWTRREVSAFETGLNLDENFVERPSALPSAVRAGLDTYRRMAFA